MITKTRIAFLLMSVFIWLAELALAKGKPYHLIKSNDPTKSAQKDSYSRLLWSFDRELTEDESGYSHRGFVLGEVKRGEGRFGKAAHFSGKGSLIVEKLRKKDSDVATVIELQVFIPKVPETDQWLLAFAYHSETPRPPVCELIVTREGKLRLKGYYLGDAESESSLPIGEWFHLAVMGHAYRFEDKAPYATGVKVLKDGFPLIHSKYLFKDILVPFSRLTGYSFVLGNNFDGKAGFVGRIDDFQYSRGRRSFYRVHRQPWLKKERGRPLIRPKAFFRPGKHEVFLQNFESPALVEDLKENQSDDLGDDLEAAIESIEKESDKVRSVPGVKGHALLIADALRKVEIPGPERKLARGSLEFWFKSDDWDNDHQQSRHRPAVDPIRHVITLRSGKSKNLLSFKPHQFKTDPQKFVSDIVIEPHKWIHVVITWGDPTQKGKPQLFMDGKLMGSKYRSVLEVAPLTDWSRHAIDKLILGDNKAYHIDEIRLHDIAFLPDEVKNARASFMGEKFVEVGNALCAFKYNYVRGQMGVSLQPVHPGAEKVRSAELRFILSDRKVVTGEIGAFVDGTGQGLLEGVGQLAEGVYEFQAQTFDASGKVLAQVKKKFRRKALPWLGNRLGYSQRVPKPFTPVEVNGSRVDVVGRSHEIGKAGDISQVRVKGENLLQEPAHWTLNNKKVKGEITRPTRFSKHSPTGVEWQASQRIQGLDIKQRVEFEYDGMAKYHITLEPVQGSAEVESLSYVIPVKAEWAQFYHVLAPGGSFRANFEGGYLPYGDGVVWDSKRYCSKPSVKKRRQGNHVPMVWLTGIGRGLCWWADNDRGWYPNDKQAAVSIERRGDTVFLKLNIITSKVKVEDKREIVFALVATPQKPLFEKQRLWGRGNVGEVGVVGGYLHTNDTFRHWLIPVRERAFDHWPRDYNFERAQKAAEVERRGTAEYPKGSALLAYHDRKYTRNGRDGEYFDWDQSCFPQNKIDCLVWYFSEYFKRGVYDGLYIDDIFPILNSRTEGGSAYVLPSGDIQPGNSFFAYREYMKRLYTLLDSLGKPPLISTHSTCTLPVPWHSFVTLQYDGEDGPRFRKKERTFLDNWSLDKLMAINIPENTGVLTHFMLKGDYANRAKRFKPNHPVTRGTHRSHMSAILLFDWSQHKPAPAPGLMRSIERFRGTTTRFFPFWKSQDMLQIETHSSKVLSEKDLPNGHWPHEAFRRSLLENPLRASLFVKKERLLLVLVNFLKRPVSARVKIDPEKCGYSGTSVTDFEIRDVDDWVPADVIHKADKDQPDAKVSFEEDHKGSDMHLEEKRAQKVKVIDRNIKPDAAGSIALKVGGHDFRVIEWVLKGTPRRHSKL